MNYRAATVLFTTLFLFTSWSSAAQTKDEEQVREAWTALQSAIKAKDADKIWGLVDSDTQADAERAAKKVQAVYKKANAKDKAEQEKMLGLTAEELTDLKPVLLFKTKRFHGKYHEIPDSKLEKITVQGDQATLNYLEEDGDKEKVTYVRQAGKWKVGLPLPKFVK